VDSQLQFPPSGVYAGEVVTSGGRFPAAINFGRRPTVDTARLEPLLEAHILDWEGDLYGQEIEVAFLHAVRPERKFGSIDELRGQISADIRRVGELLV
jgi:riboflavin kinase/FMN adenylyltransferase